MYKVTVYFISSRKPKQFELQSLQQLRIRNGYISVTNLTDKIISFVIAADDIAYVSVSKSDAINPIGQDTVKATFMWKRDFTARKTLPALTVTTLHNQVNGNILGEDTVETFLRVDGLTEVFYINRRNIAQYLVRLPIEKQ